MEATITFPSVGATASVERRQDMIDPVQTIEIVGAAGGGSVFTWFMSHLYQKSRDAKADTKDRIAEVLALRQSDREEHVLVLSRLKDLEVWKTNADREIAELHTDKFALEARAYALEQLIASLTIQITAYKENEIAFTAQIASLNEMLAAKKGELQSALDRIEAIKQAQAKGEMTHSMLYQKTPEGTETAIMLEKPGDII